MQDKDCILTAGMLQDNTKRHILRIEMVIGEFWLMFRYFSGFSMVLWWVQYFKLAYCVPNDVFRFRWEFYVYPQGQKQPIVCVEPFVWSLRRITTFYDGRYSWSWLRWYRTSCSDHKGLARLDLWALVEWLNNDFVANHGEVLVPKSLRECPWVIRSIGELCKSTPNRFFGIGDRHNDMLR